MDGQNKRWLINKNGEVLGPMVLEDLIQGVVRGEFDIKMEAKVPKGAWCTLSQHSEIVESLKQAGFSPSSEGHTTSTAHITQSTTVQNATQTGPTDVPLEMEEAPEVTVVQGTPVQTQPQAQAAKDQKAPAAAKSYQWSGAPAPKPARYSGYLMWVIVLLMAVVGGWSVLHYKDTGTSPLAGEEQLRDLTLKADRLGRAGNFQEALWTYRKALEINPHDSEVQRKMIPLLLREEHQSVLADRLIHELRLSLTRPEDLKDLYNLKGLSELYAGKWVQARGSFDESLALDSIFAPARWNRAMSYFMEEDFTSAITDFAGLISAFPEAAQLFHQWSYFGAGLGNRVDFDVLLEQSRFALQQEFFFLGLWMSTKLGDSLRSRAFVDSFLSSDLNLTQLHHWDPALFLQPVQWSNLLKLCQELEGDLESKWQEETVLGLCHLKAQDSSAALRFFEESLSRQQNFLTQILLAHVYFEQGEMERAKMLLSESGPSSELKDLLSLRILALEGDTHIMEELIENLMDPRFSLQKEYFQGWLAHQNGKHDKAKFHLRRAQALSPRFYPLQTLQKEIYHE